MSDENWIAKTIVPKSDQLNAEDLLTGPLTVTIVDVRQGSAEQPVAIMIDGGRQPYKPCKTMRKAMVALWGERAAEWIGRRLTLYADPEVKWAGVAVGGIRISHMSHIEKTHVLMLSESKGKRKPVTVNPLPTETIIDVWRKKLTGAPKPVMGISRKIKEAFGTEDVGTLVNCEPEIAQIQDEHWQKMLTGFLTDVLGEIAENCRNRESKGGA